jgi:hypothetical protein
MGGASDKAPSEMNGTGSGPATTRTVTTAGPGRRCRSGPPTSAEEQGNKDSLFPLLTQQKAS